MVDKGPRRLSEKSDVKRLDMVYGSLAGWRRDRPQRLPSLAVLRPRLGFQRLAQRKAGGQPADPMHPGLTEALDRLGRQ